MKILIAEKIAQEGIDALINDNFDVDVNFTLSREDLLSTIGKYDAIIVRSVTKINGEFFKHAENLKVVGRAGNGVDNIDLDEATKHGVVVVNTPDSNTVSAAELSVGLLLSVSRNIPQANAHVKARSWDRSQFQGTELMGKTLGIIGLGRIGSMVATRMASFGMDVIAYDPYITNERFNSFNVTKKEHLNDLVKESDFISVHTPKTSETLSLIGKDEFAIAKKGLRVVNCARGGIIDEAALIDAINDGTVIGAGIDVLVGEPSPDTPLLDMKQTVLTPHLGASTIEAQKNVGISVAKETAKALSGNIVANAVNMPPLKSTEIDTLLPYMHLGELLGKVFYQLYSGAITDVEISYQGDITNFETTSVTLAILKGVFEPILKEKINYVNALYTAQDRGVSVKETINNKTSKRFSNLISLNITSNDTVFSIAGTVFDNNIRIVNVNGFEFEARPSKHMIIVENNDTPGMIGKIGIALGSKNINIDTIEVCQNISAKKAMMFLAIDQQVSKDDLSTIQDIEGIIKASYVTY